MVRFRFPLAAAAAVWACFLTPSAASAGGQTFDVAAGCGEDRDCAQFPGNPWCSPEGTCWQCSAVGQDCEESEMCLDRRCELPCSDAEDCDGADALCDPVGGYCVQCADGADCMDGEYCRLGDCFEQVCTPGERGCSGAMDAVFECDKAGAGSVMIEDCGTGVCVEDPEPRCEAASGSSSTGSEGTAGATTGTSASGTSSSGEGSSTAGGGAMTDGGAEPPKAGDNAGGCSCSAPSPPTPVGGMLLFALAALFRRRRIRSNHQLSPSATRR